MMESVLAPSEMVNLAKAHTNFESMYDYDQTMDTFAPDPWWEHGNLGYRAEGKDAILEWYKRLLPGFIPLLTDVEEVGFTYSQNLIVIEHKLTAKLSDGTIQKCPHIAFYYFSDGKIKAEKVFCSDDMAAIYKRALGADILKVPGIRSI